MQPSNQGTPDRDKTRCGHRQHVAFVRHAADDGSRGTGATSQRLPHKSWCAARSSAPRQSKLLLHGVLHAEVKQAIRVRGDAQEGEDEAVSPNFHSLLSKAMYSTV